MEVDHLSVEVEGGRGGFLGLYIFIKGMPLLRCTGGGRSALHFMFERKRSLSGVSYGLSWALFVGSHRQLWCCSDRLVQL